MATKTVVFHVASSMDLYSSIACGAAQHAQSQNHRPILQGGQSFLSRAGSLGLSFNLRHFLLDQALLVQ
jgi:hypothetical protein